MGHAASWRSLPALSLTAFASITNYLLLYSETAQSTKWYLFGAHLLFATGGALLGGWEVIRGHWIGLAALVVSGYFLLVQFGVIGRI
jgi:TRAP-type mannitol/chloroaromatic compound transport system permease small subunit